MIYAALADLTLVLHFAFILFVVLGGIIVVKRPWMLWIHLPAAVYGVLIELGGWICPLTPLENWLRQKAGQQGYTGGFVEHYLLPVIYPEDLTRNVQFVLAALVFLVNAVIYAFVWWKQQTKST